jgi:acetyl-CoA synthetase
MTPGRDVWYDEVAECRRPVRAGKMKAEDPLFILYTSGSTGKPKGVLHTTGGYLVYASMTHEYVFDYRDGDDLLVHGRRRLGHRPLLHRLRAAGERRHDADVRGHPDFPTNRRFWEVIDKHKVNIFYTAPTAIRSLMGAGDEPVKKTSRSSLGCSARSASRSIRKPGSGTTASSATAAARWSTPGGRPRPAAS